MPEYTVYVIDPHLKYIDTVFVVPSIDFDGIAFFAPYALEGLEIDLHDRALSFKVGMVIGDCQTNPFCILDND